MIRFCRNACRSRHSIESRWRKSTDLSARAGIILTSRDVQPIPPANFKLIVECAVPSANCQGAELQVRLLLKSDTDPTSVQQIPLVPRPAAQPLPLTAPERGQS